MKTVYPLYRFTLNSLSIAVFTLLLTGGCIRKVTNIQKVDLGTVPVQAPVHITMDKKPSDIEVQGYLLN